MNYSVWFAIYAYLLMDGTLLTKGGLLRTVQEKPSSACDSPFCGNFKHFQPSYVHHPQAVHVQPIVFHQSEPHSIHPAYVPVVVEQSHPIQRDPANKYHYDPSFFQQHNTVPEVPANEFQQYRNTILSKTPTVESSTQKQSSASIKEEEPANESHYIPANKLILQDSKSYIPNVKHLVALSSQKRNPAIEEEVSENEDRYIQQNPKYSILHAIKLVGPSYEKYNPAVITEENLPDESYYIQQKHKPTLLRTSFIESSPQKQNPIITKGEQYESEYIHQKPKMYEIIQHTKSFVESPLQKQNPANIEEEVRANEPHYIQETPKIILPHITSLTESFPQKRNPVIIIGQEHENEYIQGNPKTYYTKPVVESPHQKQNHAIIKDEGHIKKYYYIHQIPKALIIHRIQLVKSSQQKHKPVIINQEKLANESHYIHSNEYHYIYQKPSHQKRYPAIIKDGASSPPEQNPTIINEKVLTNGYRYIQQKPPQNRNPVIIKEEIPANEYYYTHIHQDAGSPTQHTIPLVKSPSQNENRLFHHQYNLQQEALHSYEGVGTGQ